MKYIDHSTGEIKTYIPRFQLSKDDQRLYHFLLTYGSKYRDLKKWQLPLYVWLRNKGYGWLSMDALYKRVERLVSKIDYFLLHRVYTGPMSCYSVLIVSTSKIKDQMIRNEIKMKNKVSIEFNVPMSVIQNSFLKNWLVDYYLNSKTLFFVENDCPD